MTPACALIRRSVFGIEHRTTRPNDGSAFGMTRAERRIGVNATRPRLGGDCPEKRVLQAAIEDAASPDNRTVSASDADRWLQ